jgi:hypothetical protein
MLPMRDLVADLLGLQRLHTLNSLLDNYLNVMALWSRFLAFYYFRASSVQHLCRCRVFVDV